MKGTSVCCSRGANEIHRTYGLCSCGAIWLRLGSRARSSHLTSSPLHFFLSQTRFPFFRSHPFPNRSSHNGSQRIRSTGQPVSCRSQQPVPTRMGSGGGGRCRRKRLSRCRIARAGCASCCSLSSCSGRSLICCEIIATAGCQQFTCCRFVCQRCHSGRSQRRLLLVPHGPPSLFLQRRTHARHRRALPHGPLRRAGIALARRHGDRRGQHETTARLRATTGDQPAAICVARASRTRRSHGRLSDWSTSERGL